MSSMRGWYPDMARVPTASSCEPRRAEITVPWSLSYPNPSYRPKGAGRVLGVHSQHRVRQSGAKALNEFSSSAEATPRPRHAA